MKINLFINDYVPVYQRKLNQTNTLKNISLELVKKIYRPEHTYVLRGEPTEHPKFRELLDIFTEKNYILMTEASKLSSLIGYQGEIPYISFSYDGFQNDQIRGNRNLTYNVMKALEHFSQKDTQLRIEYIISQNNYEWFEIDVVILKKLMSLYPKMKQPYYVLFQEGDYFKKKDFTWVPLTEQAVLRANALGVLTQKNLDFLKAYLERKEYSCIALKDEIIVMSDGTVRLCLSHKFNEIIGDINSSTLEDIISSTQPIRDACVGCEYKLSCWLAYHYKESIYQLEEQKRSTLIQENKLLT